MIKFAKFNETEFQVVAAIIDRAVDAGIYVDALTCDMDISATHVHCPLRLVDLLAADDFNFAHDMRGIQRHINRKTGKLENFFLPRFSA